MTNNEKMKARLELGAKLTALNYTLDYMKNTADPSEFCDACKETVKKHQKFLKGMLVKPPKKLENVKPPKPKEEGKKEEVHKEPTAEELAKIEKAKRKAELEAQLKALEEVNEND